MGSGLLYNHLKIAFRKLNKNGKYTLINLLGLALGLSAGLLVLAYTESESSYDEMHPDLERLYRVNQTAIWNPEGGVMGSTAPPLAALLKEKYPEVEAVTRINTPGGKTVRLRNADRAVQAFIEDEVLAADSNFFEIFHIPLQEGNAETALKEVGKVVLSAETASKYFGDEPAVGKVLELGAERVPVEVSGVAAPQTGNMHFHFDLLLSMPTNPNVERFDWSWIWTQVVTYIKLVPGTDAAALEAKFEAIAGQSVRPSFSRLGMDYGEFVAGTGGWNFYLQPVKTIYLHSVNIGNRLGPLGDIAMVRLMRLVAGLIILIAVLNFINLSTARAGIRAKEVGVKKTMGALRNTLVSQFLTESILMAFLSTVLALIFLIPLQWLVQLFSGISISVTPILEPGFLPVLLTIPIVLGLLAGLYPAVYLSGFQPVKVLKGYLAGSLKTAALRNTLVTAQFTISIALMSGTVLIYQQLQYLNEKNLGFNEENVLVINDADKLGTQLATFRDEIRQMPGVMQVALAMDMPGRGLWEDIYQREGSDIKLAISQNKIDEDYFPAMGLTLARGRAFEKGRPADINGLIINETTAQLFDWEEGEALGQKIIYPGYPHELNVIGVVKDFHFQSLRQSITPMMFFHIDSEMWGDQRVVAVKYTQKEEQQLLTRLEGLWNRMAKDIPFQFSYYDEELTQLYRQERSLSGLITVFSGFSLFIAIIGLLGLLTFSAERRKKEIGIRKVLGASVFQVILMLNRHYLRLFALALFLAVPLSWTSMQNWLNSFAYRIDISLVVFLLAGLAVILLAFISVSYLSLKAASVNLAKVLKEE